MSETPTRLLDRNSLELKCNQLERENASLREQLETNQCHLCHCCGERQHEFTEADVVSLREQLRVAEDVIQWCLNKTPSPCRCASFATPPHVCVAHSFLNTLAAMRQKEGGK